MGTRGLREGGSVNFALLISNCVWDMWLKGTQGGGGRRVVYKRGPFCVSPFFLFLFLLYTQGTASFSFRVHWGVPRPYTTLRSDGEKVLVERRHLVLRSRSFLPPPTTAKIDCYHFFSFFFIPPFFILILLWCVSIDSLTSRNPVLEDDYANVFLFNSINLVLSQLEELK